jgi:hypothetical protein
LAYTEAPPEQATPGQEEENEALFVAPEDLGMTLYQALVEQERTDFESVFVTAPELVELIRAEQKGAQASVAEYIRKSEPTWTLFTPVEASEESIGGLGGLLRLVDFELGRGRNLAGKLSRSGDDIVQHWGNELKLQLIDGTKTFVVRVPKIVKVRGGWKLAQGIEADPALRMYIEAGIHLKAELLLPEHYPYPLAVGNYWKYRVRQIGTSANEALEEQLEAQGEMQAEEQTVTLSITELLPRRGYLIASLERQASAVDAKRTLFRYLATPRHIYHCTRDCYDNIDDLSYLLGYMSKQTPIMLFPLRRGSGWDKAGRLAPHNRYEVKSQPDAHVVVPAGDFVNPFIIVGSIEEGHEERSFVPAVGVVQRRVRSGTGPRVEELLEYRVLF